MPILTKLRHTNQWKSPIICGNSAILATGPVIEADEDDVSYAVAAITMVGLCVAGILALASLSLVFLGGMGWHPSRTFNAGSGG